MLYGSITKTSPTTVNVVTWALSPFSWLWHLLPGRVRQLPSGPRGRMTVRVHTPEGSAAQGSIRVRGETRLVLPSKPIFFFCDKISENEGCFPCPFGIMLTLISDLVFHRADIRNKEELCSMPGLCTYATVLEAVQVLPGVSGRDSTGPGRACSGHSD